MRLIIASNNAHKIAEMEAILASINVTLPVVPLRELGNDIPDIVEDGTTFEENATKKLRQLLKLLQMIIS
ncbi:hypothetical protein GCM10025879_05660 [Leuconostoc litchii]|nr:hypothetical protein GCM10025879_05660 [Leuconostoc litchii]